MTEFKPPERIYIDNNDIELFYIGKYDNCTHFPIYVSRKLDDTDIPVDFTEYQLKPRWIPVTERLPNKEEIKVADECFFVWRGTLKNGYKDYCRLDYGKFVSNLCSRCAESSDDAVTYWQMPPVGPEVIE